MKHLILGGARSGKSRYAEQLALASDKNLFYLATGQARDSEMEQRIKMHQQGRNSRWSLIEEPIYLAEALVDIDAADNLILIDCLTLWLSNCLEERCFDKEKKALLNKIDSMRANILFVSNEVGSGVVPLGELSREFVDQSGWLHQALAAQCARVTLVVAGLPMQLKPAAINDASYAVTV